VENIHIELGFTCVLKVGIMVKINLCMGKEIALVPRFAQLRK
jgi:hypothetical protein